MINGKAGYYPCGKGHVCVLDADWDAQVFNKENLEEAQRQLVNIIDEYNKKLPQK